MTPDQHIRGVVHNAVDRALNEHGYWLRLGVRVAITDTVIAALPEHGLTIAPTEPDGGEPDPALAEVEDLATDLYLAQDALAFVAECCDVADRMGGAITTADVRRWLEGAKCGRQLLAERQADRG